MLYQTHVHVHLGNIRRNIGAIRARVGPERKLLLSLKGNAMGHGAVVVATMVQRTGVADWFGVATVPEGIELREAGIWLPILKFSPAFAEEMDAAVAHGITLTVCDRSNILALQAVSAAMDAKARVHLKVDTGMGRIGVTPAEAPGLALLIDKDCPNLVLEGVFSHFAVSELETGHSFTEEQIILFKRTLEAIIAALGRKPALIHCSNSGGVLWHETGLFDMVRTGQASFGWLDAVPSSIPLYPGMSFHTRISFLKKVKAGTRISYGLTWAPGEDSWIATLPVGWYDGLNRLLSNRGRVLVNGKSYPIVGNVCMDQCMINLGPDTDVKVGDEAVLLGRSGDLEITLSEFAGMLKSLPYETLSRVSLRVGCEYDDESSLP